MKDRILGPTDPSITEQINLLIPKARLRRITAFVASDQFIPIMRYAAEKSRDIIDSYGTFVLNLGREFLIDAAFQKTISPFREVLHQASIDVIRNPALCISVSTGKKRKDWGLAQLPDVYMALDFHVLKVYEESKKRHLSAIYWKKEE